MRGYEWPMQGNYRTINSKEYQELIRETINDLDGIMKVSVKDQMKDLAKSALGRSVRAKDPMFWPAGMLMLGLVEARGEIVGITSDADDSGHQNHDIDSKRIINDIDSSILRHVSLWKDGYKSKIDYIDDALAGAALLKLYSQRNHKQAELAPSTELLELCKYTAEMIYGYLLNAARDSEGTIVYNPGRNAANVFADGVGQTSMFLALYGKIFDSKEALNLASTQLLNYKKFGCDDRTGLIYHGYSLFESGAIKKGLLSWGRAAGWLIMGLSEYVSTVYSGDDHREDDVELNDWYRSLSETLWSYQRQDGCFSWQIQAVDGPVDTSATGMILYGLLNEESSETVDENRFSRAVSGIYGNISSGKVQNALSSCDDFGVHYQTYGHYPWGQGAVLAALCRLI